MMKPCTTGIQRMEIVVVVYQYSNDNVHTGIDRETFVVSFEIILLFTCWDSFHLHLRLCCLFL